MANSVNISIEAPIENQIQEITYDGQEIYQAPLSMSENLSRLAQKIDFAKTDDDFTCNIKKEVDTGSDVKSEEDKEPGYQSSLWPWDSVRNKLRNALTEVCVLADVLSIAKEKRYMVLDPIQADQIESRPMVQVYGRKKALSAAGAVLLHGVERLRASETMRMTRNMPDFHIDLLRLRQNWRLKKVSNTIVGDLSYRTAGSKFSQTGVFEVTKAPEEQIVQAMSMNASGPAPSALRVTVPPELQGVAFISVLCQKEQEDVVTATISSSALNCPGTLPGDGADLHWQQKLEAAQNVLFCKELFARLAAEAVQLDASIPHMVVGNQIMATVLPGIQLLIGLCHNNRLNNSANGENVKSESASNSKSDHDHVLEHSLHQLLRAVHHANTHHPFPHPATGPLGPSKRRSLAGPMAADRYELLDMSKEQSLLEQIIQQAQHFFMRRRSEYVLDTIAKELSMPIYAVGTSAPFYQDGGRRL
ncbi:unnamed protein product [Leptidea sinapis]|uniref:Mediator of RNA polymerase II transcription subunit 17 n=1 Tax=Leptidea sinapis TaxID=189913 RepID=A0A5E4Q041_9NEOP|nr:unnamed protein product [Leptidea sinapis]